ncbi:Uncharacterised protein [uncultured archaeon]|nr:Uncharacterised protein [uncultured archaeon]
MGIIDQIQQMKSQGIPDDQIVENLKQQGVSPKEINDALNQAQIKNAVMGDQQMQNQNYPPEYPQQDPYAGQQQYYQEGAYPQQYTSDPYSQQQMPVSSGIDANTVMEIAEKVFEEKIKKIEKQVSEFSEFKTLSQTKLDNLSERLKRMESLMDQLQIKILEKISSYGQNLEEIKGEMSMMEDSFQKMTNPLLDKSNSSQERSPKSFARQDQTVESSLQSPGETSSAVDEILRRSLNKKK